MVIALVSAVLEKVFRTVVEEMKKSDTKTALPLIAAAFKGYRNNLNHRSARFDVHPLLALRPFYDILESFEQQLPPPTPQSPVQATVTDTIALTVDHQSHITSFR
eukprot:c10119_g2_i1.p1 GENE.c10119_g2_i1~~c10119_g2_i1.p1  ORF type:complete len:105 (+),score=20.35 c10119_g2_i1:381-695(+)